MTDATTTESLAVLSLWQPWASLVALGVKTVETRNRSAPRSLIGKQIAIQATKRAPKEDQQVGRYHCHEMADDTWAMHQADTLKFIPLPLGCIVATARLDASVPMVDSAAARNCLDMRVGRPDVGMTIRLDNPLPVDDEGHPIQLRITERGERFVDVSDQRPYGDFQPGRWAWLLADVEPVDPPVPFKGGQGFSRRWVRP